MIRTFRDLDVWNRAMEVARRAYRVTAASPRAEQFGLVSQMRRASASVPANIAEGHARDSTREYVRFVSIAIGSLAELSTLLELSRDLYQLDSGDLEGEIEELRLMLRGLQGSLKARIPAPSSLLPVP